MTVVLGLLALALAVFEKAFELLSYSTGINTLSYQKAMRKLSYQSKENQSLKSLYQRAFPLKLR